MCRLCQGDFCSSHPMLLSCLPSLPPWAVSESELARSTLSAAPSWVQHPYRGAREERRGEGTSIWFDQNRTVLRKGYCYSPQILQQSCPFFKVARKLKLNSGHLYSPLLSDFISMTVTQCNMTTSPVLSEFISMNMMQCNITWYRQYQNSTSGQHHIIQSLLLSHTQILSQLYSKKKKEERKTDSINTRWH